MRTWRMKFIICIIIVCSVVLLFAGSAKAVEFTTPYFNFVGDFNYNATSDELVLSNFEVTQVTYLDGSSAGNDDISSADVYWNFISGGLFNNSGDNLDFGGPARFEIKDGSGYVFLTASLSNFQLSQYCPAFPPGAPCQDPSLNSDYTLNSLWSLVVDPSYATSQSIYIQELGSVLNRNDGVVYNTDINIDFTFTSGDNAFIADSSGTTSGKLVVMPEPVSAILFLAGGVPLAVRRYRQHKKVHNS